MKDNENATSNKNFTREEWQSFIEDLQVSQTELNAATANPIFCVQITRTNWISCNGSVDNSDKKSYHFDDDNYDSLDDIYESLDGHQKHQLNSLALPLFDQLYADLSDDNEKEEAIKDWCELTRKNFYACYGLNHKEDIAFFLTHQEATKFIANQSHNYPNAKIYVKSLWPSSSFKKLVSSILSGELVLKTDESV